MGLRDLQIIAFYIYSHFAPCPSLFGAGAVNQSHFLSLSFPKATQQYILSDKWHFEGIS